MGDYNTLKSVITYTGAILAVRRDEISLPNGAVASREIVQTLFNGGAAVLPVDDRGNIYLVRQFRQPAKREVLEVCAGMIEDSENPRDCALRELAEEMGFRAATIRRVCEPFFGAIGFCEEKTHLFIAEGLTPCERNLDPEEFIEVERYALDEAVTLIKNGGIVDAKTIVAVLALRAGVFGE